MALSDNIQIATSNYRGKTVFSYEYGYYDVKYKWEATAFVAHCVSQWGDAFEHLLDCFEKTREGRELEIVDYWGPRFVKKFQKDFPLCDSDWYRDVFRAILRSLILPKSLIDEYFSMIGYEADEVLAQGYIKRYGSILGTDLKPLPNDWLKIGEVKRDGTLSVAHSIMRLANGMDKISLTGRISWLVSGFTKNYHLFLPGEGSNITINAGICSSLMSVYPEMYGKGKLKGKWLEEVYRAKFLSIKIPERLLKAVLTSR